MFKSRVKSNVITQPIIPSNYGEFVDEPLVNISSATGSKHYVAKEELNLLAKLVRCDEQEKENSEGNHKTFKINLFDTADIDININKNVES